MCPSYIACSEDTFPLRQQFKKHLIVFMARSLARTNRSHRKRARVVVMQQPPEESTPTIHNHRQVGSRRTAKHQSAQSLCSLERHGSN